MENEWALLQISRKYLFHKIGWRGAWIKAYELSRTLRDVWYGSKIIQRFAIENGWFWGLAQELTSWRFVRTYKSKEVPTRWCAYLLQKWSNLRWNFRSTRFTWLHLFCFWIQILLRVLYKAWTVPRLIGGLEFGWVSIESCIVKVRPSL